MLQARDRQDPALAVQHRHRVRHYLVADGDLGGNVLVGRPARRIRKPLGPHLVQYTPVLDLAHEQRDPRDVPRSAARLADDQGHALENRLQLGLQVGSRGCRRQKPRRVDDLPYPHGPDTRAAALRDRYLAVLCRAAHLASDFGGHLHHHVELGGDEIRDRIQRRPGFLIREDLREGFPGRVRVARGPAETRQRGDVRRGPASEGNQRQHVLESLPRLAVHAARGYLVAGKWHGTVHPGGEDQAADLDRRIPCRDTWHVDPAPGRPEHG